MQRIVVIMTNKSDTNTFVPMETIFDKEYC